MFYCRTVYHHFDFLLQVRLIEIVVSVCLPFLVLIVPGKNGERWRRRYVVNSPLDKLMMLSWRVIWTLYSKM